MYAAEAAVELLIGHSRWLDRADFVDAFVEVEAGFSREAVAWVEWQAVAAALDAGRLVCSGSERQLLRAAASLAEGGLVDLGELVCALDVASLVGLARVVLHGGGHRDAVVALDGRR